MKCHNVAANSCQHEKPSLVLKHIEKQDFKARTHFGKKISFSCRDHQKTNSQIIPEEPGGWVWGWGGAGPGAES